MRFYNSKMKTNKEVNFHTNFSGSWNLCGKVGQVVNALKIANEVANGRSGLRQKSCHEIPPRVQTLDSRLHGQPSVAALRIVCGILRAYHKDNLRHLPRFPAFERYRWTELAGEEIEDKEERDMKGEDITYISYFLNARARTNGQLTNVQRILNSRTINKKGSGSYFPFCFRTRGRLTRNRSAVECLSWESS